MQAILDTEDAKAYLSRPHIGAVVEGLLAYLVENKPVDPLLAVADWATKEQLDRKMDITARRGTQLDHNIQLDIDKQLSRHSFSNAIGVIGTIGPISQPVDKLKELMGAGLSIVRLNASHGDHTFHGATIENARLAAKELGLTVAIALDTKGPEIRTGDVENNGEISFAIGDTLTLTTDDAHKLSGTKERLYVDYKNITGVLDVGQLVFVDDGLLALKVTAVHDNSLDVEVVNGHTISSRRGVNLPHAKVDLPAVSDKDKADLQFAADRGLDMVFASFIRKGSQVKEVREHLKACGAPGMKIIAKIENHEGVENLDEVCPPMPSPPIIVIRHSRMYHPSWSICPKNKKPIPDPRRSRRHHGCPRRSWYRDPHRKGLCRTEAYGREVQCQRQAVHCRDSDA